jgi:hypothetical protein
MAAALAAPDSYQLWLAGDLHGIGKKVQGGFIADG